MINVFLLEDDPYFSNYDNSFISHLKCRFLIGSSLWLCGNYQRQGVKKVINVFLLEDDPYFSKIVLNELKKRSHLIIKNVYSSDYRFSVNERYDIGIIDIGLAKESGISFVKKHIERFDTIIYLTSHIELMKEAFGKNVIAFIDKTSFYFDFNDVFSRACKEIAQSFIFSETSNNEFFSIRINQIIYIEKDQKKNKYIYKE